VDSVQDQLYSLQCASKALLTRFALSYQELGTNAPVTTQLQLEETTTQPLLVKPLPLELLLPPEKPQPLVVMTTPQQLEMQLLLVKPAQLEKPLPLELLPLLLLVTTAVLQ